MYAGDCRYSEASDFFMSYWNSRITLMTAEAAAISANATCSTYSSRRKNRKTVTATIYFQMCTDGSLGGRAVTGGLLETSNAFRNLYKLHKAGGRWLPLSSNAL
jgi:hypothetical protein